MGAELAEHTLAQSALITGVTPDVTALRSLLSDSIANDPRFSRMLAGKLSGIDTFYDPGDPAAHPLTGTRAHDPEGQGVLPLLHDGRAVLLAMGDTSISGPAAERAAAAGVGVHSSRLAVTGGPAWAGVTAALLRPDGHVWWATGLPAGTEEFIARTVKALENLPARF
ncbi:hypothetical protein [Streptomyces carpinensis]|uniref:aromatic-ring hydroxylase C-terminal domain-containing protein n=1 Tax=Streptomyces carpinensis TaxID=66369 RepID=UPI001FC94836|nr:hypothetical protein [Streptomyces carpinensis]